MPRPWIGLGPRQKLRPDRLVHSWCPWKRFLIRCVQGREVPLRDLLLVIIQTLLNLRCQNRSTLDASDNERGGQISKGVSDWRGKLNIIFLSCEIIPRATPKVKQESHQQVRSVQEWVKMEERRGRGGGGDAKAPGTRLLCQGYLAGGCRRRYANKLWPGQSVRASDCSEADERKEVWGAMETVAEI